MEHINIGDGWEWFRSTATSLYLVAHRSGLCIIVDDTFLENLTPEKGEALSSLLRVAVWRGRVGMLQLTSNFDDSFELKPFPRET